MSRFAVIGLVFVLTACGTVASRPALQPSPSPTASPTPSPSPSPSPTASPTPSPSPNPSPSASPQAQAPSSTSVTFAGLPNGSYVAHLHSICNGAQSFHITVLQELTVRGGTGTIQVPSGYFGRGLCVIVYGTPSLATVIAVKRI
jgi:hypothetical protein